MASRVISSKSALAWRRWLAHWNVDSSTAWSGLPVQSRTSPRSWSTWRRHLSRLPLCQLYSHELRGKAGDCVHAAGPAAGIALPGQRRMHQQQVDIAVAISVPARRRAEDTRVHRLGVPRAERVTQALPQFEAQSRQRHGNWCGEVLAVELVHPVPAHLRGAHDSLLGQARQAPAHADLRSAGGLGGHLAHGQRFAGPGQHSQDRPVQRGGNRSGRVSQVHDQKAYDVI